MGEGEKRKRCGKKIRYGRVKFAKEKGIWKSWEEIKRKMRKDRKFTK